MGHGENMYVLNSETEMSVKSVLCWSGEKGDKEGPRGPELILANNVCV